MSEFASDLKFAESQRGRLKGFYSAKAFDGRYVFINKQTGIAGSCLQNMAVDTIMQVTDDKEIYIEEKIVRWKGRRYTAFTLETESCTVPGREKSGWMQYGKCDYLIYGLTLEDNSIALYILPFKKLKDWFWKNYEKYPVTTTSQINKTRCRVVPIEDIRKNVGITERHIGTITGDTPITS